MKKIFYIANIRLPTEKAHGVQIMKTCEAIAKSGADLTLVVPRRLNKIKTDPFDYYGVEKNFLIARVPTIDLVGFGKIGFFIETAIFSELAAWYIRFHSKGEKVIYSRDVWPLLNTSLLGWKLFWEAHMGSESFFTRKLIKKLNGLVAITAGLKNLYQNRGLKNEKITVIPDAVDVEKFDVKISQQESRKRLGLPLDKKIVMYIGLFDEWKGYQTLLSASKLINDENIKVVMIGGTEKQVNALREKYQNVIFLGYRQYSELPQNQKAADLLVIPNSAKFPISKHFTSPLKLFAHMASSVPIIAADVPSIREIVSEKEAVFFESDNSESLAKSIKESLSNPGIKEKAGRAREKVGQYTWNNRGKNILDFIDQNT